MSYGPCGTGQPLSAWRDSDPDPNRRWRETAQDTVNAGEPFPEGFGALYVEAVQPQPEQEAA